MPEHRAWYSRKSDAHSTWLGKRYDYVVAQLVFLARFAT